MTHPSPELPALQRLNDERELFTRLSHFQETLTLGSPVPPALPEVLRAAQPAFEAGFAYSASMWSGELQVTIHHGAAELGSCAPADPLSYTGTCARLLAGLLGIPLLEGDDSCEPEPSQPATASRELRSVPDTTKPRPQAEADELVAEPDPAEPEPEADDFEEAAVCTAPDPTRDLTEQEKAAAIDMIKAMEQAQRRVFSKAFREVFQVPADAKAITPFITRLEHLHYIDRVTVEAAGGIAA